MPASPAQMLAAALACAALAFLIHRLHRAMRENRFLPLTPEMKGQMSGLRPGGRDGTEPFVDMHHARSIQRALMNAFLLSWMWILSFAAVAVGLMGLKALVTGA